MSTKNETLVVGAIAAAVAFVVVLFVGSYRGVVTNGSGGLGAVSAGVIEALVEGILVGIFVSFTYWLVRRLRSRTATTRP